ncbi:ATP-binding protein [Azospirillum doebereinerae]
MRPARAKTPERKVLTMMFVDIVSSSALVAGRDPEDADQILLPILQTLVQAVPRYGGMVAQLLGDGFMAVFGAPDAKEDHALRACLAAQDIVRATVDSDLPDFQIRIGISSGEVVAHVVENGVWADYRMVGECVHAAAKLQQRADPNTAQFSRDTLDLIPVGVVARPVGSLTLASGATPIPAFTLEGARAVRRTATDLLLSADAPFVGRAAEAATLFAMADQAEAGTPSLLLLRGEAGIGKSRLVGEFFRDPRSRRWNVLPWPQMPIRRLGDPDDLEAVALSLAVQLTGSAEGAGPSRIAAAAGRRAGTLAADAVRGLFGLPAVDPLWSGLDPAQRLSLTIDGLVGAVLELASHGGFDGRPLLVLVEDAHWARPVMVRLLDALAAALRGSGARLLLVATMRPPALRLESAPEGWSGPQGARRIDLDTLDTGQVQSFLDYWLGSDWSLAELKAQVTERSQGIPLYLEEILRTLEGSGAIAGAPGAYRLADPAALPPLPRSLHGLLAARIDLLETEPRRVLLNAAVVGPTFDVGLLQALSAMSGAAVSSASLPAQLAYLERAGFILRARLLPNLEYGFHHALIREVAYATLTKADRKGLHGRLLVALRQRRDHDLPNRADLLAHHAFMAENWSIAYLFGHRAGVRAESRSKLEESSRHYANAAHALDRLEATTRNRLRRIDMSIALARSQLPRGLKDTDAPLEQARELARSVGDARRYARASSMLAAFEWSHGDIDRAIDYSRQGLGVNDGTFDLETQIQLLGRLGGILAEKGLYAEGREALWTARRLLPTERSLDRFGLAVVGEVGICANLARNCAEIGRGDEAVAAASDAVEAAERSNHNFSKMYAHEHLGWVHLLLDDGERAMPHLETALDLCAAVQSRLHKPFLLGATGYACVKTGKTKRGLGLFEQCFSIAGQEGMRAYLNQIHIWFAETLLLSGRTAEARERAATAQEFARLTGQIGYFAKAQALEAEAVFILEDGSAAAVNALRHAEANAGRLLLSGVAARCARVRARGASHAAAPHLASVWRK